MPTEQQKQFKSMMRDQWSVAGDAWGPQHDAFSEMSKHVTAAIVHAADLAPGQHVLDIAGGTGEPALTVAERVAPGGTVVCSDLVQTMLSAAEANAKKRGLSNMSFELVDVEQIPFEDDRFDRVTCRFGIMFAPDPPQALREIRRVLTPGGRVAFAVWAPVDENPNFNVLNGVLAARGLLQPPPPGTPTPFTFAEFGSLSARLREAGFSDISEEKRSLEWAWPGTTESFVAFFRSTFPAVRKALDETPEVAGEIAAAYAGYSDGSRINLGAQVYIVSAVK